MKFFSWVALILLIVGGFGIITGIKTNNAILIAMSNILWTESLFFEMIIINDKINDALGRKDE